MLSSIIIKLFSDLYQFCIRTKEIGQTVILKKHAEMLHSILNFD